MAMDIHVSAEAASIGLDLAAHGEYSYKGIDISQHTSTIDMSRHSEKAKRELELVVVEDQV